MRRALLALLCTLIATNAIPVKKNAANVLIVYSNDQYDQNKAVALEIQKGAEAEGSTVRCLEVSAANYKNDVFDFADAVILGSGVYNGNASPDMLGFINTFDFMDDLSTK